MIFQVFRHDERWVDVEPVEGAHRVWVDYYSEEGPRQSFAYIIDLPDLSALQDFIKAWHGPVTLDPITNYSARYEGKLLPMLELGLQYGEGVEVL